MNAEKRPRMVRLIVRLPPDAHERLQAESARQSLSMAALIRLRLADHDRLDNREVNALGR